MPAAAAKAKVRTGEARRARPRQLRPSPNRKLGRGDWLVQQVKSQSGVEGEQRKTLAALGLLKIGRCGLFYGDRPEMWGQISKVQHLVAIRPLTQESPKTRYRVPDAEAMSSLRRPVKYEVDGRDARHYDFDGDSFFSFETFDGSIAINWSTALPAVTVLERLDADLIREVESCTVFNPILRAHQELPGEDWHQVLRAEAGAYPFVRLESKAFTLVWQRPAYPTHVDEDIKAGRIGILTPLVDSTSLVELVRLTATPLVGSCAEQLVADAAAASKLPHTK